MNAATLFRSCLLAGLVLAAAPAAAADTALLAAARAQEPVVIRSLQDMVAIESGSDDAAGLAAMARYVEVRLQALGADTERVAGATGKPPGLVKGTFKGRGKARIALIAHMDTVYRRGILQSEPYRREGNKLYGPGIADAKGGVAVILHALELLKARGWDDYAELVVLFNADEEVGSAESGELIAALGERSDVVLSFEPTAAKAVAGSEGVLLKAAGTAQARLLVEGRAAHAGAAPEQGRNALLELSHQLLRTREVATKVPGAQMNWTTASAGTVRNQIPDRAEAGADVRFLQAEAPQRLLAALQDTVSRGQLVPDTRSTVTLEVARPMYVAGDKGMALARLAQSIYAEMDGRPLLLIPETSGGTDAGFAGRPGNAAVLESLGLAGWGYHARDEYIEVDSIAPRLYLAARMLMELGRQASQDPAR